MAVASASSYRDALLALKPPGSALPDAIDSNFSQLIAAFCTEFAWIERRAQNVIQEAGPVGTFELFDEWEH